MSLVGATRREDSRLYHGIDQIQARLIGSGMGQLQTTRSQTVIFEGDAYDLSDLLRELTPAELQWSWFPVTRTDPRLIARLSALFLQRDAASVSSYLISRPSIVSLLIDIWEHLMIYFPSNKYLLRLVSDDEGFQNLRVDVLTSESLEDAMCRLRKFDEGWWMSAAAAAAGEVVVDISFE